MWFAKKKTQDEINLQKLKNAMEEIQDAVINYKKQIKTLKENRESELVSFGNYLLSKERFRGIRFLHPDRTREDIKIASRQVNHPDLENWKYKQQENKTK